MSDDGRLPDDLASEPEVAQAAEATPLAAHEREYLEEVERDDIRIPRIGSRVGAAILPPFVPLSEVVEEPLEWRVSGLLVAGELAILGGAGGVGKSTSALHIACAVAAGQVAFGLFPTARAPVVLVSGEDTASIIRNRAQAFCHGHGWDPAVLKRIHVLALSGLDLRVEAWRGHLSRAVASLRPGLTILDPLAGVVSGDENDNGERSEVVRFLRTLTGSGNTVLLVHHLRKAGPGTPDEDLLRGATSVRDASRQTYLLRKSDDGVVWKCLKFSRAVIRRPFLVRPHVEPEGNEALWRSAIFRGSDLDQHRSDQAERFIVEQLSGKRSMNTTMLKKAAQEARIGGERVSKALTSLAAKQVIQSAPGVRNAKWWSVSLPTENVDAGQARSDLAGQAGSWPGKVHEPTSACQPPNKGAG